MPKDNRSTGVVPTVDRLNAAYARLTQSLSRALPPHQFTWHRSHGLPGQGDLTIMIGTRHQVMAIGSAVLVAGWLGIATSSMVAGNAQADVALAEKQAELAKMQNSLKAMRMETAALKGDVAARAEALEARQAFLAALLTDKRDMAKLAQLLPRKVSGNQLIAVEELVGPPKAKRGKGKIGKQNFEKPVVNTALIQPFEQLENQQLAFVDKAAGAAEAKLRDTQALIRRLGLDPARFVRSSDWDGGSRTGMGGPFIPVSVDAEPRFKDLFISWKKLTTLQAAVAAIPAYMPVKDYRYTSSYGYRYDPFNGGTAMHAGVDMAGAHGEPIYASADGVVQQAGRSGGYGNLVELRHGKGIDTRYGHLSAIAVKPGERVRQGQLIGRMGSTGRSTGTHLHFEVRVDGRAVNPRPFLDASAYVLAAQSEAGATMPAQDFGPVYEDDTVTAAVGGMTPIRNFRR
jgi:murein DD-endopeptidase MepM/ murein hydrolase activator NlpD